jgi:phosphatidylserine synthase
MVSHIRYRSFKGFDLKSPRSYLSVVAIVLVLVAVLVHPRSLMVIAGAYLLWGPTSWLAGWLMRGRSAPREDRNISPSGEVVDGAPHRR